jgi:hypothetical protein
MLRRVLVCALAASLVLAAAKPSSKTSNPHRFSILGASVEIRIVRDGTTLPATLVPSLRKGDTIELSFPRGVQYSRSPRWHLIVADMYRNYLEHAPTFPIPDADLSRAKPGAVWRVTDNGKATPLVFLVPEDGSRHGRGIPDARAAIEDLTNRALLARTAELSAGAQAKASTMDEFLRSLAQIQPGELPDGRARVAAATQSLFGYDLADAACFAPDAAQSTQYACTAQAALQGYDSEAHPNAVAAVGAQLSVNTATYGMLIGALYQLLARRRVAAHYLFIPGALKPGHANTDVYVDQPLSYDATAAKPSSIVYFNVTPASPPKSVPSYGAPPSLAVCVDSSTLAIDVPFTGLPVYFRSHEIAVHAAGGSFSLPASYDPLLGYRATLSAAQLAMLHDGGEARVTSTWGFSRFTSPAVHLIEPRAATWTLDPENAPVVSGERNAELAFTDGGAGMGSCVASVDVTDAVGRALPVSSIARAADRVSVTLDARDAIGPQGSAIVRESEQPPNAALSFSLLPAMPDVTSAVAYLPHGTLVLRGSGLKYINTVTLERTGLTFASGTPNADGSWTFTLTTPPAFQPAWEHETMAIAYSLIAPDTRTGAVEADVRYAP